MLSTMMRFLAALVLAVLLLVALLPTLLSNSMGTSLLTSLVNGRISGKVGIQELSLGWLGGQKVSGIELLGPTGDQIVGIKQVEIDASLFTLLFNPRSASSLRVSDLHAKIIQDSTGATNLEEALGQKSFSTKNNKVPVFVDNLNIEVKRGGEGAHFAKVTGLTRQADVKGQFFLDASLGAQNKIKLRAEHFPVLVLDQTLAIKNPKLAGFLLNLLGDHIDLSLDQTMDESDHALQLLANTPFFTSKLKAELKDKTLVIEPIGIVSFNLPVENIQNLLVITDQNVPAPKAPLKGQLEISALEVPLDLDQAHGLFGKASLSIDPNQILLEGHPDPIDIKTLRIDINSPKNESEITFKVILEAAEKSEPMTLNFEIRASKTSILAADPLKILDEGVMLKGQLKTAVSVDLEGTLKSENTLLHLAIDSKEVSLPSVSLMVESIPFDEFFDEGAFDSTIEGVLTIKNPQIKGLDTALIDEVTIPWSIDPDGSALKLAFTGIKESAQPKENIKGTLRVNDWKTDQGVDFASSALHLNVKLDSFEIASLDKLFPSHSFQTAVGKNVNAEMTASRDIQGNIKADVDFKSPKSQDAFLKSFTGKFALQKNMKDVTFEARTQQAIGATEFLGTFHNLFDDKGSLQLDKAFISVKGNLKHFPVGLITKLATGDNELAGKMEAVLGSQVDADLFAEIRDQKGPIEAKVKGLNGEFQLKGFIQDDYLYLKEALTASLKVTPQLEQTLLRQFIPILGSAISSEQPISLKIPSEGFRLSLKSPSFTTINLKHGELDLNKMQFSRDSQLGKVVSLLGVNSNTFSVWFTPVYFTMGEGVLTLFRTDMLVANGYPLASFGEVDFGRDQLNLVIALSGYALKKAFKIHGMKNTEMLQIPVRGSISKPQLDLAKASTRISALIASSQGGPEGQLIGTAINLATDLVTNDKMPAPTTSPLPWEGQLSEIEEKTPAKIEDAIEKPVEELKKGAKKLLKGLFSK